MIGARVASGMLKLTPADAVPAAQQGR
jgi:hypothetical protein